MNARLSIALSVFALAGAVYGSVLIMGLAPPRDERTVLAQVFARREAKELVQAHEDLLKRLKSLERSEVVKIFGQKLAAPPEDRVLPIFARDGVVLPGVMDSHDDFHNVSNFGYFQFYYRHDYSVRSFGQYVYAPVFFFRVDDKFVPLKTTNDISSRLEWEKPKTEALRKWLDEHLPKGTTNALKQVSPVQPEKNRQSINNVSKAKSPSRQ